MTAREDVLRAARSLTDSGRSEFTPVELVVEAKSQGSRYAETTLRTHIVAYMCIGSPSQRSGWDDLLRVARGRYRLNNSAEPAPAARTAVVQQPADRPEAEPGHSDPRDEWHWEGNVQAALVTYLALEGWEVVRVADTDSGEQGHDVHARRDGIRLLAEVKGYPSERYVRGPKRGQRKPTSPNLQARHWFANALLTGHLTRGAEPNARVALVFPDFVTYRRLAERTRDPLGGAGIEVWFVHPDATVEVALGRP